MIATSYITDDDHKTRAPHDAVGIARYLALVNLSLADAGIEGWAGKYDFDIARPITYIRSTPRDPAHPEYDDWTPLGQVASNGAVANVTPPFPAYPSGHAVFGAAVFKQIANVLGYTLDEADSKFDFVSDEYNGETFGLDGKRRPLVTAHYVSLPRGPVGERREPHLARHPLATGRGRWGGAGRRDRGRHIFTRADLLCRRAMRVSWRGLLLGPHALRFGAWVHGVIGTSSAARPDRAVAEAVRPAYRPLVGQCIMGGPCRLVPNDEAPPV